MLDPGEVAAVTERALGMQKAEVTLLKRLRDGEKLGDITGATVQVRQAIKAQKP